MLIGMHLIGLEDRLYGTRRTGDTLESCGNFFR
jgi:hypothetical protein